MLDLGAQPAEPQAGAGQQWDAGGQQWAGGQENEQRRKSTGVAVDFLAIAQVSDPHPHLTLALSLPREGRRRPRHRAGDGGAAAAQDPRTREHGAHAGRRLGRVRDRRRRRQVLLQYPDGRDELGAAPGGAWSRLGGLKGPVRVLGRVRRITRTRPYSLQLLRQFSAVV